MCEQDLYSGSRWNSETNYQESPPCLNGCPHTHRTGTESLSWTVSYQRYRHTQYFFLRLFPPKLLCRFLVICLSQLWSEEICEACVGTQPYSFLFFRRNSVALGAVGKILNGTNPPADMERRAERKEKRGVLGRQQKHFAVPGPGCLLSWMSWRIWVECLKENSPTLAAQCWQCDQPINGILSL